MSIRFWVTINFDIGSFNFMHYFHKEVLSMPEMFLLREKISVVTWEHTCWKKNGRKWPQMCNKEELVAEKYELTCLKIYQFECRRQRKGTSKRGDRAGNRYGWTKGFWSRPIGWGMRERESCVEWECRSGFVAESGRWSVWQANDRVL